MRRLVLALTTVAMATGCVSAMPGAPRKTFRTQAAVASTGSSTAVAGSGAVATTSRPVYVNNFAPVVTGPILIGSTYYAPIDIDYGLGLPRNGYRPSVW